jgi:hypothetical protein
MKSFKKVAAALARERQPLAKPVVTEVLLEKSGNAPHCQGVLQIISVNDELPIPVSNQAAILHWGDDLNR